MGMFNPSQWKRNALQKASLLDLGPMQALPKYIFEDKVLEILGKVAIPSISIMLTLHPVIQGVAMAVIHAFFVVHMLCRRSYIMSSTHFSFVCIRSIGLW